MFLDRCIICLHQNLFLFFFSLSLNCVDEVRFLGRKCNLELWNNLFCDQRILYTHELLLICCFLSLTSFYFYFYFFVIFFCLQTHEYVCYSHSRFYHYISCLLVWINGHTYNKIQTVELDSLSGFLYFITRKRSGSEQNV